jgi:hypothetical protein
MKFAAALLCLSVLASACESGGRELGTPSGPSVGPSPGPPSSPPPFQGGRQISVGEEVTGTLTAHGTEMLYELTAPSDGTLILRLSWETHRGLLELRLAGTTFAASPPDWSPPIVARLSVAAGRTYPVRIMDGAPWDYDDLSLPFVVTTFIE